MDTSAQVLLSFSGAYYESTGSQYDENVPMSPEYAKDLIAERCDGIGCNEMDAVYEIFREMIDNLHQYTIPRRLSALATFDRPRPRPRPRSLTLIGRSINSPANSSLASTCGKS
jgi:hypothetical protein